jgi:hypothetical protein
VLGVKGQSKMAYDRSDWHYGGDYPDELPQENGGTHIGMFLAWVINNNLEGNLHKEDSQQSLKAVRNREMTGREFLEIECDGKFWEDDLSEEGNAFAKYYYESNLYFADYESTLAGGLPTLYHVENSWVNYERISLIISSRYIKWKNTQGE